MCVLSYSQSARALQGAAQNGNMELTTFLLDNGVDIDAQYEVLTSEART